MVDTTFTCNAQGQRTHFARTKNSKFQIPSNIPVLEYAVYKSATNVYVNNNSNCVELSWVCDNCWCIIYPAHQTLHQNNRKEDIMGLCCNPVLASRQSRTKCAPNVHKQPSFCSHWVHSLCMRYLQTNFISWMIKSVLHISMARLMINSLGNNVPKLFLTGH